VEHDLASNVTAADEQLAMLVRIVDNVTLVSWSVENGSHLGNDAEVKDIEHAVKCCHRR